MQFINKSVTEPVGWNDWFTVPVDPEARRSYDYRRDASAMPDLRNAKEHLLIEQGFLCAYCQSLLSHDTASIEHFVPKSKNVNLSTSYHNLVAVCKDSPLDSKKRKHCDKDRKDQLLTPIIFYNDACVSNATNHAYFTIDGNLLLSAKHTLDNHVRTQVQSFIEILNLNHSNLVNMRIKNTLSGIIDGLYDYQRATGANGRTYWQMKLNEIINDPAQPYRQFLLIYIAGRLGIN
jgi:uncharacterized protein (TIGR02646 family)